MKTRIITLSVLAVAASTLFSCNKIENTAPAQEEKSGIPFEFIASNGPESKTTFDGAHTNWKSGDKVALFHAVANDDEYINDGAFEAGDDGASVVFSGTLASALSEPQYDWYAIYPYNVNITTPANTGTKGYVTIGSSYTGKQKQTKNSNMTHIAGTYYPLAGKVLGVDKDAKPAISMSQLTTVLAIEVTNETPDPISISEISFTGTEDIVGNFFVDFTGNPVVFTPRDGYTSSTATLQVVSGETFDNGESATFYLAVKPFTASASSTISFTVTGSNGTQNYNKVLSSNISFVAGTKNTIHLNYEKELVLSLPFEDDMAWADNGSEDGNALSASDFPKTTGGDVMYSSLVKGYKGVGGIKLGTSGDRGSITTVNLDLSADYTIIVSAMTWGNDNSVLQVFVDGTQVGEDATLYNEFVEYVYKPGAATNASNITFKIDGKRGYINYIRVIEETSYVAKPVIHLTSVPEEFTTEAGTASIGYQILNPTSGTISASAEKDWVSGFNYETENTVKFNYTANTGEERSQVITLTYSGAENKAVTVSQEAYVEPGSEKDYTFTIDTDYFNSTSYAKNNGQHSTIATATDSSGDTFEVTWTSNQVMLSSSDMQWQKNNGYIYNNTNLGTIKSVTVNSSTGTFTTYYGTAAHPTSGTTVGNGYFTVKVGNATGKTSSIVIVFTK